jgi:hypothetical protein
MKTCKRCGQTKPCKDFYPRPDSADGYGGKCKECVRQTVQKNYRLNRKKRAEYEARRRDTSKRRQQRLEASRRHRQRHPEKERARSLLAYHVRKGYIVKQPCCRCGNTKAQAHHPDYSKPLEIVWLCRACHMEGEHGQTVNRG